MKILIADDDPQILRALRITLAAKGYTVITANDGAQAISQAVDHHPDLLLLDLGMPRFDGLDVIAAVRGWSQLPILVVSGRAGSADKVDALDAGADDYITKPFAVDELLARIRALTRRVVPETSTPVVRLGKTTINLASHSVYATTPEGEEQIKLTPTEWKFIEILIRNAGKLVSRQMILTSIWGTEHAEDTGYLRLYMSQLRQKLEPTPSQPQFLLTEPGMGYRLEGTTFDTPKNTRLD